MWWPFYWSSRTDRDMAKAGASHAVRSVSHRGSMSRKISRNHNAAAGKRQEKFAAGIALGKTKVAAARDAGYAPSTALKKSYAMIDRPLVRSALRKRNRKLYGAVLYLSRNDLNIV
jgi:hypothetical protein